VLKVHLGIPLGVAGQQHLAVVLPALVLEAALLVRQVKHLVNALGGVVVPGGEHQQVRTVGDLRLVPGDGADALAHGRVRDHHNLERLQPAGGRRQACGFKDALNFVFGHRLGGIHLLGGVAPLQRVQQGLGSGVLGSVHGKKS
jgi:hypothetical protein